VIKLSSKRIILLILLINFLWTFKSLANESFSKIIATVNGVPITSYDLDERLNIILFDSNLVRNKKNKNKFSDNVLNRLIEDELKLQEAEKINPNIIEQAKTQANELLLKNFGPTKKSMDQNFKLFGATYKHFEKLFTADLVWASILKSRHKKEFDQINIQVKKRMDIINKDLEEPHYKLSEIEIKPNIKRNKTQTKLFFNKILEALSQGADFHSLAKQFSSAKSRNNNGKIGWVKKKKISPELLSLLDTLEVGQISEPIETIGSYKVYRIEGEISNGMRDKNESYLKLMKLVYPLTKADEETKLDVKKILLKDLSKISNCDDLSTLHFEYGNNSKPEEAEMQIINLEEEIKQEVIFLSKNEYTQPILTNQGFIILMVCDRFFPPIDIKDEIIIKKEIENELFVQLSDRYLNRIRRSSFIEIKNK